MRRLAATILLATLAAPTSPTAIEQFNEINQQARAARQAGDKPGYLAAALKMEALLNHSPASIEAVARAYAQLGQSTEMLGALEQFVALGQADDSVLKGENKTFLPFAGSSRFQAVLRRMAGNTTAVSHGERMIELSDSGLLPEDMDFDSQTKSFLITSILEQKIVRVGLDGKISDFAQSPSHWPVLAIKIDSSRELVWATEVALDGFTSVKRGEWGRSAVLCFNLKTGELLHRFEGPANSGLGDLAVAPHGEPIVCDGNGGGVYGVGKSGLTRIDNGEFISPQTPAVLPRGTRILVPDYVRGIGILDLTTGQATWMNRDGGIAPLNGVDGVYVDGNSLLLTQNGTSPQAVVRLRADHGFTRILAMELIDRSTSPQVDPTHGVVVGQYFYYIANSSWNQLDDHGDVKTGSKLTPARIMRYRLR